MVSRLFLPLVFALVAVGAFWQSKVTDVDANRPPLTVEAAAPRLSTPLLSGRRLPEVLQGPEAQRRLVATLDEAVAELPAGSCLAVNENWETRYAHQADLPLVPASTQKLLTAAAALAVLGPDYVFTTRVMAQSGPVDGVVDGNVWLVGAGDPLLMTADYADRFSTPLPYTDLNLLADQIAAADVDTITGAVVGDESYFDDLRWVATWPERFRAGAQNQSGPLSALSVNDGFSQWDSENTANGLNTAAEDPAAFAAAFFDDLLEDRSLRIYQRASSGLAPEDALVELASIDSPPVAILVAQMLQASDNTTAELLVKALASFSYGHGTTEQGLQEMSDALGEIFLQEIVAADGSGLDPGNLVTCSLLVELLGDTGGWDATDLRSGLALAGSTGTMRNRLVGSSGEGRVRAKTGTLNDVVSLAGVVETLEGRTLTFALISNADPLPENLRQLHDQIVLDLVAFPVGPPLALLEPFPVLVS
ncbi:MAG: D-alanyl-D-alanine carboxypeptidase/D-alanyl-D-alanine-endopeptidase [Actinobacteria bacterium]|nr:D-alanyl-D-alanine carboxypeptidase/D-alanyl-D-alanine-endopeptidase [Actinomycetota bacterium]